MHFQVRYNYTHEDGRHQAERRDLQASGPLPFALANAYRRYMQSECDVFGGTFYVTNNFSTYSTDTRS